MVAEDLSHNENDRSKVQRLCSVERKFTIIRGTSQVKPVGERSNEYKIGLAQKV